MLFSALKQQGVHVWDYSGPGEDFELSSPLKASIVKKIDANEYFIAVITPDSIHEKIGYYCRFEVLHALDTAKLRENKILPIVLCDPRAQWTEWHDLYQELAPLKRIELESFNSHNFERHLRDICRWLSVEYLPSTLRSKETFIADAFLKETDGIDLRHADFVILMEVMDTCASSINVGNWATAKEKADLFVKWARHAAPHANFLYPLIIRGICELQLGELQTAKKTFTTATTDECFKNNPLYGLGFAGLARTHHALAEVDEGNAAYKRAGDFMKDDKYLLLNQLAGLMEKESDGWDDRLLDEIDHADFPAEHRARVLEMKGIAKYKKNKFLEAVQHFGSIDINALDEAAAVYYALSLRKVGGDEQAISVVLNAALRLQTPNLFHVLADCYLNCDYLAEALSIYKDVLCAEDLPANWKRQYFIEYACILRNTGERRHHGTINSLCEKVLDFGLLSFPHSHEAFFYLGFANHLLGRKAEARYDYERSGKFCDQYYDRILAS